MKKIFACVVAVSILACTEHGSPTGNDPRLAPQHLTVTATSRVIASDGGARAIEVSATLKNETNVVRSVAVDPDCPLVVSIQPDPTGEPQLSTSATMFCAETAAMLSIAPGDSAILTRVIGPDSLATYGPGTFGLGALVTTNTALMGIWAGSVQLPLSDAP